MSLADELRWKIHDYTIAEGSDAKSAKSALVDFVLTKQDAILTALRGRDAVLEEAATHFDKVHRELWTPEVADELRAMKEPA